MFSLSCQCVHQDWPCPPLTAPRSDSRDLLHCLTSTIDRLLSSLFGSCSRHQVQISISRFSTSLNQQKLHNEKKDYKSTKFTKIKSGQQKLWHLFYCNRIRSVGMNVKHIGYRCFLGFLETSSGKNMPRNHKTQFF